jgi:hypothetical protein
VERDDPCGLGSRYEQDYAERNRGETKASRREGLLNPESEILGAERVGNLL